MSLREDLELIMRYGKDNPIVPATPTVRVRIAVATDETGRWYAYGHRESTDEESSNEAIGDVHEPSRISFVEADVPLPAAPQTVEGTVTP